MTGELTKRDGGLAGVNRWWRYFRCRGGSDCRWANGWEKLCKTAEETGAGGLKPPTKHEIEVMPGCRHDKCPLHSKKSFFFHHYHRHHRRRQKKPVKCFNEINPLWVNKKNFSMTSENLSFGVESTNTKLLSK